VSPSAWDVQRISDLLEVTVAVDETTISTDLFFEKILTLLPIALMAYIYFSVRSRSHPPLSLACRTFSTCLGASISLKS
jgi:hypothetical protein